MTQTALTFEGLKISGQVGMGFPPPPNSYRSVVYNNTQPPAPTATWLHITPDSRIHVYCGKVEYGQNIRSGLAVEVADELRAPLDSVDVTLSDTDLVPWDMGTFGSQSTARAGLQLRKAAATAREALLDLAANHLDLPVSELVASDGAVATRHDPSRRVSYGDLVAGQEIQRDVDEEAPLTEASDFTVMGRPQKRIDAIDRVTGRTKYSQDISVPGMLNARIIRPPSFGARLIEADGSVAERMPGVVAVVRDENLLAVVAETDEQAEFATRVVRAQWDERPSQPSRFDMPKLLLESAKETMVTQDVGSLEDGFRQADHVLESTYYLPYISNAPMEPKASVAVWDGDRLTLWAGTQRPFGVRQEMAERFGVPEATVHVITPDVGGGFGSKSYYPVAMEAA
ncbi:MAG TPA: molybdopterin cofactor-binding domain-containing protein, partial [Dehalococcoidia bacterium]